MRNVRLRWRTRLDLLGALLNLQRRCSLGTLLREVASVQKDVVCE